MRRKLRASLIATTALFGVSCDTSAVAVQVPYHELYGDWPLIGKIAAAPFNSYSIGTLGGNCSIQGTLLFQSSGGLSKCLGVGPAGQVLVSAGAGADLTWAAVTTVASQAQNLFWASPNGSSGTPSFRAIVANDLPVINNSSVPTPTASARGGIESLICAASNWLNTIPLTGIPACSQPKYSDIIGVPPVATTYTGIATAHTYGKAFETSGYSTAGDGGDALMVPAYALLRMPTGASGCSVSPSQCVNDGVTNSTTTITSISAVFNSFDVLRPISDTGGCIPTNDTIAGVTNSGTAILAVAATGNCSADTFNFGGVAANSPGYTTDIDGNHVMFAPERQITPQMFGATPQIVGSTDSGPQLQVFLDATTVLAQYGSCGFIGTRFYDNATQLQLNITHANAPCLTDSSPQSDDIQFGSSVASPNFVAWQPNGNGGQQGGGMTPTHSTFYWRLRLKVEGNTPGIVAQIGDVAGNNDASNGIRIDLSSTNDNYLGTACAGAGLYNSSPININCNVASRSPNTDASASVTAAAPGVLTDAALGFTAADVGATVTFTGGATANSYCPAGVKIASVAAGVATLNNSSIACTLGSGVPVKISGGTSLLLSGGNINNAFFGIVSSAAYAIDMEDFGAFTVSHNTFNAVDFDGQPAFEIYQSGAARNNTFIGGSNTGFVLACAATNPNGIQEKLINILAANGYGWNIAYSTPILTNAGSFVVGAKYTINTAGTTNFTLIGASSNAVGTVFTATGVGSGTGTAYNVGCNSANAFYIDAPGQNLAGGASFMPNTPVSTTVYINTTGQAAVFYGRAQTQTSVTVNGSSVVPGAVASFMVIIKPGDTFSETCSVCTGSVFPLY